MIKDFIIKILLADSPWLSSTRNLSIILFIFSFFIQPNYSQTISESSKSEMICQALNEIVNDGKAPGMIAAIISSKGVIAIGSAGVRKVGSDIAIKTNDILHLGSCTKAMTSTMIATLVAEGKLKWESKLLEVIPELKGVIHPSYYDITLWQLLTHRAGLPLNPSDWGMDNTKEAKEYRLEILKDNFSSFSNVKIGEFNYSNFGYMIAACMAEKVTGLSWEQLMKQRLFDPLCMYSSGFGEPDIHHSIVQPWGHFKSGGKWKPSADYDTEAFGPAGEINCNVEDWAKFLSLQLTDKNPILDRKYLNKLIEPTGFYAGGWGVIEDQSWAKGKVLTHNGSNGIWFATVMVAPKLDRAYVVSTNSCDFGVTEGICNEIIRKLIRMDLRSNNS